MCYSTTCTTCGKTTWGGCGAHVDQVFANVPPQQRCTCHETLQRSQRSNASTSSWKFR